MPLSAKPSWLVTISSFESMYLIFLPFYQKNSSSSQYREKFSKHLISFHEIDVASISQYLGEFILVDLVGCWQVGRSHENFQSSSKSKSIPAFQRIRIHYQILESNILNVRIIRDANIDTDHYLV